MIRDAIDERIDRLAQLRRTTGLYKAIAKRLGEVPAPTPSEYRIAKQRAHAAFLAYESAVRDHDAELIEAARLRFIDASDALKKAGHAAAVAAVRKECVR